MGFLVRRLAAAPIVLLAVAILTYGIPRILRPDMYRGETVVGGTLGDLEGILLHFDFGRACGWPGCPEVADMWAAGMAADVWLLLGALAVGVFGGVLAGIWCAGRPRSRRARLLETAASIVYCTPVYVMGLGLLLLFNPIFGSFPVPGFFEAEPSWAQPWSAPWAWLQALLVPWLVVAAPLGAMCLRLTLATTRDAADEDYVRTAFAKGLSAGRVMRGHVAPASYVTTASFVAVSVPLVVSNMVLVERVLAVPGFFRHTWKAIGHSQTPLEDAVIDFPMIQGLTMWGAVLIVGAGLLVDAALLRLDPRIRAGGRSLG